MDEAVERVPAFRTDDERLRGPEFLPAAAVDAA
jgi:hypothetical protein